MEFLINLLTIGVLRGSSYILMALGLGLIFGVMNIPNFAHGELYMIGAYLAYIGYTTLSLPPVLTIIFAAAGTFVVGGILEIVLFRPLRKRSLPGRWIMNCFLLTLGISIILQNTAQYIFGYRYLGISSFWPGTTSILGTITVSNDRLIGFAISALAVLIFWYFLTKTKTGRAIQAVSEDEIGAELVGVNLNFIFTLTFALGAGLAGIAGSSLLAINAAHPMMGLNPLFKSWFVIILIGMGNVGPIFIGGVIVGILETLSYAYFGAGWQNAVSLAVIIIILIVAPQGIFGKKGVQSIWEK